MYQLTANFTPPCPEYNADSEVSQSYDIGVSLRQERWEAVLKSNTQSTHRYTPMCPVNLSYAPVRFVGFVPVN